MCLDVVVFLAVGTVRVVSALDTITTVDRGVSEGISLNIVVSSTIFLLIVVLS